MLLQFRIESPLRTLEFYGFSVYHSTFQSKKMRNHNQTSLQSVTYLTSWFSQILPCTKTDPKIVVGGGVHRRYERCLSQSWIQGAKKLCVQVAWGSPEETTSPPDMVTWSPWFFMIHDSRYIVWLGCIGCNLDQQKSCSSWYIWLIWHSVT